MKVVSPSTGLNSPKQEVGDYLQLFLIYKPFPHKGLGEMPAHRERTGARLRSEVAIKELRWRLIVPTKLSDTQQLSGRQPLREARWRRAKRGLVDRRHDQLGLKRTLNIRQDQVRWHIVKSHNSKGGFNSCRRRGRRSKPGMQVMQG